MQQGKRKRAVIDQRMAQRALVKALPTRLVHLQQELTARLS
jgi:hypothetical protein